ncbi:head-tail connector protein [Brevundimonas sp. TWP1-2-1b1]|uniref:head-tail connector protein n=1 Tax=unclassified Brevundimonas TaxID=2622653 RepID=UPI003CE983D5
MTTIPWNNLTRITPPADPLISLDDAKAHVGASDYDEVDDFLTTLVEAATDTIEGPSSTGAVFVSQTWRATLDHLPSCFSIPLGPIQSITAITYVDQAGVVQTIDPATYHTDFDRHPAMVAFYNSPPVPARVPGSVKVTFVAGYGDPSQTPAKARHAVRLLVGEWFKNREASTEASVRETPIGVSRLLAQLKRF